MTWPLFKDPAAAARLGSSAKEKRRTCSANSNGAANVLAVVLSRLRWSFLEDESMTYSRPGDTPIDLPHGSKKNFHEELARSVRAMLLARVPAGHDWQGELDLHIDIAKTRILEDASLASVSDRQPAQNAIRILPKSHAYTKSPLRALRTGSVLTRARCKAAWIIPQMISAKGATKEKTTFIYSNRVVSTTGIDLQAYSMTQRGVQAFSQKVS